MVGGRPRARDRWVGARLRAVRVERTGLSLESAAQVLGWSPSMMSRVENGKRHTSSEEVAAAVMAYGLSAAERERFLADARWDDPSAVWDRLLPGCAPDAGVLAVHTAEASALVEWSVSLVPALLQTEGYALALMRCEGFAPEEAWMRWQARKQRQRLLGTFDYTVFLSEAAVHRPIGGATVLRDQLAHLLGLRDRGIGVRLVHERLPAGAVSHSWVHMTFPRSPPLVATGVLDGQLYLHDEHLAHYDRQLALLDKVALPTVTSCDRIRAVMNNRGSTVRGVDPGEGRS